MAVAAGRILCCSMLKATQRSTLAEKLPEAFGFRSASANLGTASSYGVIHRFTNHACGAGNQSCDGALL